MEDNTTETTTPEVVEKKPNKIISWIKDHKTNIRDFAIGGAAVLAIAALAKFGSSSDDDYDDDEEDYYDDVPEIESGSESTDAGDTQD